jgi:hypothetical protein
MSESVEVKGLMIPSPTSTKNIVAVATMNHRSTLSMSQPSMRQSALWAGDSAAVVIK